MNAYQLKFWPEVQRASEFASQNSNRLTTRSPLAAVVRQDPTCKAQYRDPDRFFNATYLTRELKQLFKDVLGGLSGDENRIFSLRGDRDFSQTFLGLYHLTKHRQHLTQIPQFLNLPNPESVQVFALTGFDLDIHTGIEVEPGLRILTPWGYLAWQLGGSFGYSLLKIHDEQRVAPSQYLLRYLLGDRPTLILLENFLEYVHTAIEVLGTDDPFLQQLLLFLQNTIAVMEDLPNTVLVDSLPGNQESLLAVVESLVNPNHAVEPQNFVETRNFASLHSNEISPQIQEPISATKKAIAVVSLDEQTYHPRPVSAPKRRNKIRAKMWVAKSDRLPSKTIPFPKDFSNQVGNFFLDNLQTVANQYTTPETGDRIKGKIKEIANPGSDRLRKDTAVLRKDTAVPCPYRDGGTALISTLDRVAPFLRGVRGDPWHKPSEIELVIKELMARSPPK